VRVSAVYSPPSFDKLRMGVSARYQSKIHHVFEDFTADGEDAVVRQKGYAIVDLMARYQLLRNVSLSLNVANVTNVKYWSSLQWDQAYYGAPRTVSGTIGVNF
jgi:outer membrane receptor for ferric coprogen and ferric-rhodotorulic acid